jgi:hypothetical protein
MFWEYVKGPAKIDAVLSLLKLLLEIIYDEKPFVLRG